MRIAIFLYGASLASAFFSQKSGKVGLRLSSSTESVIPPEPAVSVDTSSSWQENLDKILDIDTSCDTRRTLLESSLEKVDEISRDVVKAIEDQDITILAPPSLKYGKAVVGMQAVQRQIFNDILPDLLTKAPKFFEVAPKVVNDVMAVAPEKGQSLLSNAQAIANDASLLESTVEDMRKEALNSLRSTPEGVYTPPYVVLEKTDDYEVRKYYQYSVCTTNLPVAQAEGVDTEATEGSFDPLASATGFNTLAEYIFGKNANQTKMAMTTPVVMEKGTMSFVMPEGMTSSTAPLPDSDNIEIKDIPSEIIAIREFPGIVTDGEITRQRAKLEDALLTDNVLYDNLSFKVLQYNGPFTLLWLRRNEVSLKLINFVAKGASEFFSAPEAGD